MIIGCYHSNQRCDGKIDCSDGSDEDDCMPNKYEIIKFLLRHLSYVSFYRSAIVWRSNEFPYFSKKQIPRIPFYLLQIYELFEFGVLRYLYAFIYNNCDRIFTTGSMVIGPGMISQWLMTITTMPTLPFPKLMKFGTLMHLDFILKWDSQFWKRRSRQYNYSKLAMFNNLYISRYSMMGHRHSIQPSKHHHLFVVEKLLESDY